MSMKRLIWAGEKLIVDTVPEVDLSTEGQARTLIPQLISASFARRPNPDAQGAHYVPSADEKREIWEVHFTNGEVVTVGSMIHKQYPEGIFVRGHWEGAEWKVTPPPIPVPDIGRAGDADHPNPDPWAAGRAASEAANAANPNRPFDHTDRDTLKRIEELLRAK